MLREHSLKPEEKLSVFKNIRPICVAPTQGFSGEGRNTSSPKNACVGGYFFFGVLQISTPRWGQQIYTKTLPWVLQNTTEQIPQLILCCPIKRLILCPSYFILLLHIYSIKLVRFFKGTVNTRRAIFLNPHEFGRKSITSRVFDKFSDLK